MNEINQSELIMKALNDGWVVKKSISPNTFEFTKGSNEDKKGITVIKIIASKFENINKNLEQITKLTSRNRIKKTTSEPILKNKSG